jgi:hypothetical protein
MVAPTSTASRRERGRFVKTLSSLAICDSSCGFRQVTVPRPVTGGNYLFGQDSPQPPSTFS